MKHIRYISKDIKQFEEILGPKFEQVSKIFNKIFPNSIMEQIY